MLWQQESDGPWSFRICNQRTFWTTRSVLHSREGLHHAWRISFETGEIRKFADNPIAHWVDCFDNGLYFCDMQRGRKEFCMPKSFDGQSSACARAC